MKHTRRTLFRMLAGLFAGWGAAKAAPLTGNRTTNSAELIETTDFSFLFEPYPEPEPEGYLSGWVE